MKIAGRVLDDPNAFFLYVQVKFPRPVKMEEVRYQRKSHGSNWPEN